MQALDFVISEARKYKIRLILSLINNWDSYGGKPQYVKWGKDAGLNLTSDDDFFSHPTLRSYYKAHVKACKPASFMLKLIILASISGISSFSSHMSLLILMLKLLVLVICRRCLIE